MNTCHDCNAKPGKKHKPGCDVERCPACGGQAMQCLEGHFDKKMVCLNTDTEVKKKELLPWTGEWPGKAECREYGFWCYWKDGATHGSWVRCGKDHPEAREDLNRLVCECVWSREQRKFILRSKP